MAPMELIVEPGSFRVSASAGQSRMAASSVPCKACICCCSVLFTSMNVHLSIQTSGLSGGRCGNPGEESDAGRSLRASGLVRSSTTPPASIDLLVGLWSHPQIRLQLLIAPGEHLVGFLVRDGGEDDHVVSVLPVHRRCHLLVLGKLERVDDPEDFVKVSPRGCGIGERKAHLLVRVDNEDGTHGRGGVRGWVDHAVKLRDTTVRVR